MIMNEQSKGMRLLYTVFLLAVTVKTAIDLYDRLFPKEKDSNCKRQTI